MIKLNWTNPAPPDMKCSYDHVIAETPFGSFLLTWKGWQKNPGYGFNVTPWGKAEYGWNSLEDAKQAAEEMERRINDCYLLLQNKEEFK